MAYTIKLLSDSAYICLTNTGEAPFSEYEKARFEAVAAMKSHGRFRLLVDVSDVVSNPSVLKHYEFTTSHIEHLPRGVSTAVLMRPGAGDASFIKAFWVVDG